jgi:hypothetical protein
VIGRIDGAGRLLALTLVCAASVAAPASSEPPGPRRDGGASAAPSQSDAGLPGELHVDAEELRAVLLEDGDFFEEPSSDGAIVARFPAGTVLGFAGEASDAFGRAWSALRDPQRIERRRHRYLVPFDLRTFTSFGGMGAVLADREPTPPTVASSGAPTTRTTTVAPPWWAPAALLTLGHSPTFDSVVAMSARAVREADVREAIDLLGGIEALGAWPVEPLPGELYLPELLPVLFQFDGHEWRPVRPVRLFSAALNLLGNPALGEDVGALPRAGGPTISCWDLIGALTPRRRAAGSVAVAPPVGTGGGGGGPPPPPGMADFRDAPATIRDMLPPAPLGALVPSRVDPPEPPSGVQISDRHGRQAVYLEQVLGPGMTRHLRGRSMVLDIVARAPETGTSGGAATFGVDVEGPNAWRFELAFTVPDLADALEFRLLPLDKSIAVEQSGEVIIERVALRLAHWDPEPAPASYVLNRVHASTFESRPLYTRTPVALTTRSVEDVAVVWPQLWAAVDWSSDDRKLILAGEVRHGMSPAQVRLSWGEPDEAIAGDPDAGIERNWRYADRYAVFADDKLIAFPRGPSQEAGGARIVCPGGR